MENLAQPVFTKRYQEVTEEKAGGATYTPKTLADFVARQVVETAGVLSKGQPIRILDPALGHGELLLSLLESLMDQPKLNLELYGFETDIDALDVATARIKKRFPKVALHFELGNFLDFVIKHFSQDSLFCSNIPEAYDLIIANPPYVRTQIMGATQAQILSKQFGLSGRVDLYYAFVLGMSQVLKPKGIAGIITSNRFMTTKSGSCIREAILKRFNVRHAWDLGDTKIFDAAVLPAVLLVEGKNGHKMKSPDFTSIYQIKGTADQCVIDPVAALDQDGIVATNDGRCFQVQRGKLDTGGIPNGVWRVGTDAGDAWLATVAANSWGTFSDIGKIRVGVKTCADKIFIRNDWENVPEKERPELLKPLTTHHVAHRFKSRPSQKTTQIVYPHEVVDGRRRAVDLTAYPRSKAYLDTHKATLKDRKYVIEAGREWYEIWVPQDPAAWKQPKLVFRDISEEPTFWIDLEGTIVNGDCYWLICQKPEQLDLLWLALAVGNSSFIESFYDRRFNNKLYAGRRRFITQYVEKFPIPDPKNPLSKEIVAKTKQIYEQTPASNTGKLQKELDAMVWKAFGLIFEEVSR